MGMSYYRKTWGSAETLRIVLSRPPSLSHTNTDIHTQNFWYSHGNTFSCLVCHDARRLSIRDPAMESAADYYERKSNEGFTLFEYTERGQDRVNDRMKDERSPSALHPAVPTFWFPHLWLLSTLGPTCSIHSTTERLQYILMTAAFVWLLCYPPAYSLSRRPGSFKSRDTAVCSGAGLYRWSLPSPAYLQLCSL